MRIVDLQPKLEAYFEKRRKHIDKLYEAWLNRETRDITKTRTRKRYWLWGPYVTVTTTKSGMSVSKAVDIWRDVVKDPKTDPTKASKAGRLALIREDGEWATVRRDGNAWRDELKPVFNNGFMVSERLLAEIRERSNR